MVERSFGFDGGRLAQAREARGLSCADVARLIGVSRASASNYEMGKQVPRPDIQEKIADVLNLPMHFFLRPKPALEKGTIFYRSNAVSLKAARVKAERRHEWLREIVGYLKEYLDFPKVNLPLVGKHKEIENISMQDIEEFALECRKFFRVENGPIPNMALLLENNGIIVSQGYFDEDRLDAFSECPPNEHPFVFLGRDKLSAVRSRFDAAHELAHILLHRDIKASQINNNRAFKIIEEQAHRFAGAFLLPESDFLKDLWNVNLDAFRSLKARWKVSIGAMIMRCHHLECINEDQTKRLWISYNRRGWRVREPLDDQLPHENCRLLKRSFEMLVNDGIRSKEQILSDLRLAPGDIEDISGLPIGFFSEQKAEVLVFPKVYAETTPRIASNGGKVIEFRRKG